MAAFSNADALAVQLEVVHPLLPKYYDCEDTLGSRFSKITPQEVSTRDFRLPIPMSPGGKFRQINSDGGAYGRGSGPNYQYATLVPYETAIVCEWTKKLEYVTDSKTKSVANVIQKLVADMMVEYKVYHDKILQTSGDGKLASGASSTTSGLYTVVTCAAPFGSRLLRKGQTVQVFSSSAMTTYRGTLVVDSVDYPNSTFSTITTNRPAGFAATDVFAVENSTFSAVGTVTKPVFMNGIANQHSNAATGTWQNLSRVDYPEVRTPAVNAASGALTTTMPNVALAKIEQVLGQEVWNDAKPFWYMSLEQHVAYTQLIQNVSEVSLGTGGSNGNVDMIHTRKQNRKMAGVEIVPSLNADNTRIDLIDGNNWVRATWQEPQIVTMAGMTKLPIRDSSGGYGGGEIFYISSALNFAAKVPRKGAYVYNLAVPSFA